VDLKDEIVAELDAHRQIHAVMSRYARGVDRCDRDAILSCYHPDAFDDHGPFKGSPAEFADWVIPAHLALVWTSHYILNIHIELQGDVALTESTMIGILRYTENGELYDLTGGGRYLDRFENRNGSWLIARRQIVGDWTRIDKVEQHATGGLLEGVVLGRRDGTDPSYAHFAGFAKRPA
jgi:ketosteroid isomerase-like protein